MFRKYIKKYLLYNELVKFKPYCVSHIALLGLFISEILAIIYTFILHNEDPNADYIIEYSFAFELSHFFAFMFFGFGVLLLFSLQFLIKTFFKKSFITNNKYLLNNKIYHIFWVVGSYISIILAFSTLIYILKLIGEGIEWLYYQYLK